MRGTVTTALNQKLMQQKCHCMTLLFNVLALQHVAIQQWPAHRNSCVLHPYWWPETVPGSSVTLWPMNSADRRLGPGWWDWDRGPAMCWLTVYFNHDTNQMLCRTLESVKRSYERNGCFAVWSFILLAPHFTQNPQHKRSCFVQSVQAF